MDNEESFFPHYNQLIEITTNVMNQNYLLYQFIAENNLHEEWNQFYRQQSWVQETRKHKRKGVK